MKYKKIFRRMHNCIVCGEKKSTIIETNFFLKEHICYRCLKQMSRIFHLDIRTIYIVFSMIHLEYESIQEIISLGKQNIGLKKILKDRYNLDIDFF